MDAWLETFARANFQRSADTAHDLKTPLNVAVLNLELLRMRLRKIEGAAEDEKLMNHAAAVEQELRRMARIVDAFFILSTPPKNEGDPTLVDCAPFCEGVDRAIVRAHESRLRQAFKLFFEGAAHVLKEEGRRTDVARDQNLRVVVSGEPYEEDLEVTKIFKLYFSDLALASARLIVETYGGELTAEQEGSLLTITMSLPLVLE